MPKLYIYYFHSYGVPYGEWKCYCSEINSVFDYYNPSECRMMVPGTYAEMHEDYD